jgi:chromosome segregation ATPase
MYSKNSDKVAPFMQKESEHAGELDRLIGEVKHDLENVEKELKGCQEQYAKYKKIDEALQTDCAQLKFNMQGGASITVTIRKMKEDMQKLFNDLPNITAAQAKLKRHRLKALKEMETSWEQFANLHVDLVNQFPRAAEMTPTIARIFMNVNDLRAKMRDEQERLQDQEIQVSSKLEELRTSKNRAQVSQNEYKEFRRIYFHKYGEMKEKELLRQLKQIRSRVPEPDNARQGNSINVEVYSGWLERFKDELNAKYDQLKANVDEDRENIDSDIHMQAKQYEDLKKAIAAKEKALEKLEREFEDKKQECQRLKETWLPELDVLVSDVSKRLKTYFMQIKCDGEVSINRPDNPSSYSKYELQIKVSFRDSVPLEALNVGRQSGGERSVSTMLFLLAMPTKNCPFRLVDEINQGMDQQNERNVIDVLSNVSNSPNCCQFFIITPKLLPNIDFPDNSRIHVVHSIPNPFPFTLNDTAHSLEHAKALEE